jgi:hypothetical protein
MADSGGYVATAALEFAVRRDKTIVSCERRYSFGARPARCNCPTARWIPERKRQIDSKPYSTRNLDWTAGREGCALNGALSNQSVATFHQEDVNMSPPVGWLHEWWSTMGGSRSE